MSQILQQGDALYQFVALLAGHVGWYWLHMVITPFVYSLPPET